MPLPCKPYPMQHQWQPKGQWLLVRPETVGGLSCRATCSLDRLPCKTKLGLQVSSHFPVPDGEIFCPGPDGAIRRGFVLGVKTARPSGASPCGHYAAVFALIGRYTRPIGFLRVFFAFCPLRTGSDGVMRKIVETLDFRGRQDVC